MANRLLRYELILFRRSFADAFERKRDRLLLLVVAIIALFWLRERAAEAGSLALPPGAAWLAAAAMPIGFACQRLVQARLVLLAEHSPFAADALDRNQRLFYLAAAHVLALLTILAGAALLAAATHRTVAVLVLAAGGYGIGVALAARLRFAQFREKRGQGDRPWPYRGRRAAFCGVLQRQTLDSARPQRTAVLILLMTFTLTAAAAWFARGEAGAEGSAAIVLASLPGVTLASRIDSGLLGFLPSAGYPPSFVACAVVALPIANMAAAGAAILLVRPLGWPAILTILALLHAAIVLAAIARSWLYPGRNGRSVDLQVQLEFAGLVLIAMLLPPLALLVMVWRLAMLHRHCRSMLWVHA